MLITASQQKNSRITSDFSCFKIPSLSLISGLHFPKVLSIQPLNTGIQFVMYQFGSSVCGVKYFFSSFFFFKNWKVFETLAFNLSNFWTISYVKKGDKLLWARLRFCSTLTAHRLTHSICLEIQGLVQSFLTEPESRSCLEWVSRVCRGMFFTCGLEYLDFWLLVPSIFLHVTFVQTLELFDLLVVLYIRSEFQNQKCLFRVV